MRRLATLALLLLGAGALASFVLGSSAQGSGTSRFDVIFDDARGLVGGQLVKIAGARAGLIQNVVVTPSFKARIEATVDSRFMPFHQDATCAIRPEGLIAENYIDCDPGTAASPPLRAVGGHPPTVPVTNTTEPVSLLDLFNMFNLPTRQRFAVIINELGIGTSGRGTDFNAILLRANPALTLARRTIAILAHQRAELATIVDATNTIAAEAAGHTANVQSFLDRAASLSTLTAAHRGALSQAINRLPGLLAVAQPSLQQLDTVAVDGTPLLQQLHVAAPSLNRVASDLGPFVTAAKPALASLGTALKKAIPAIKETTPVVDTLRSYTSRSLAGTLLFAKLSSNLQQHGFVENFFSIAYYIAASLSRFDSTSHLLPLLLVGAHNGTCGNYSTTPVPGCSAHYGQRAHYQPSKASADAAAARARPRASGGSPAQGHGPRRALGRQQGQQTQTASNLSGLLAQAVPSGGNSATQPLQSLVNYLLK